MCAIRLVMNRHDVRTNHDIANIICDGNVIGVFRYEIWYGALVIHAIKLSPEHRRRGYGRKIIDALKTRYGEIIAERVTFTGFGFWEKMGFKEVDGAGCGRRLHFESRTEISERDDCLPV